MKSKGFQQRRVTFYKTGLLDFVHHLSEHNFIYNEDDKQNPRNQPNRFDVVSRFPQNEEEKLYTKKNKGRHHN